MIPVYAREVEVEVPENHWEWVGQKEERNVGLTTLRINGVSFHLEALRVEGAISDGRLLAFENDDHLDALATINGDGDFQTVEIDGDKYVLSAAPYC